MSTGIGCEGKWVEIWVSCGRLFSHHFSSEYYASDFKESEWEGETSSELDEHAFVVDQGLAYSDEEEFSSQNMNVVYDAFLYDFYHVPERKDKIEDKVIKEDGTSDNEGSLDRDSNDESGEGPTQYGMYDPSIDWKKMKPHLMEKFVDQKQLRPPT
ncbi:hypothetical protein L1887_38045 [Cichorium endivia]|nr:hypothetical protein L1887_38045 [Cichorium endivia]